MQCRLSAAAIAVAAAFPFHTPSALAQERVADTVVVTATRQAQRADEVLSSVDVIERAQIERAGHSTLVELLSSRPGIQVTTNGGPGANTGVFIRGANSGHTLVLIDGMRVGSATTGQPALEMIPLALVERIEILRGPASALYGSDAIGGVIQIFTRKGEDGLYPGAYVGAGTEHSTSVGASLAGGKDRLRYSVAAGQDEVTAESLTHPVHPYPARLHPATAGRLVPIVMEGAARDAVLLDPFCGSGTVLVEARAVGGMAVGVDLNPLAVRLARVKTWTAPVAQRRKAKEMGRTIAGEALLAGREARRAGNAPPTMRSPAGFDPNARQKRLDAPRSSAGSVISRSSPQTATLRASRSPGGNVRASINTISWPPGSLKPTELNSLSRRFSWASSTPRRRNGRT